MDEIEASRLLFQDDLTAEDTAWLREQFALAGLPAPTVDIGWLTFEPATGGGVAWPVALFGGLGVAAFVVLLVLHFAFGVAVS